METSKKLLVICGDSFNAGIGLENLEKSRYGQLVADYFNWDVIHLARGSASNYSTYLQAEYARTYYRKPHLVIMGVTSYDRIEWFSEENTDQHSQITLHDLNYHDYPPHRPMSAPGTELGSKFHLSVDSRYKGKLLTEQIVAIDEILRILKQMKKDRIISDHYYKRLSTEHKEKLQLILDYYMQIFDHRIKKDYDVGILGRAYWQLTNQKINSIIVSKDDIFKNLIPTHSLLYDDWFEYGAKYPDKYGSCHANEEGHKEMAKVVIDHIITHGYE